MTAFVPRCAAILVTTSLLPAQQQPPGLDARMASIATAYAAKVVASAVFVSGRSLDSVLAEELAPDRPLEAALHGRLQFDIDRERGLVQARLGDVTVTAVRTRGLGCALALGHVAAQTLCERAPAAVESAASTGPWTTRPKHDGLEAALDAAFAEQEDAAPRRTRAIVVVHRGELAAERYAEGYHADMPLPGWSVTKSLTNALLGIAVRRGRLELDDTLRTPTWPQADPRRATTLHDLLAMRSGLAWYESYADPSSDVLHMLFASADHGAVQAEKALAAPRGTKFVYSSGTTNLLCKELRRTFADDAAYWAFPSRELFAPLGMSTAVLETDPSGTFVGSSYGFASARDWARLGQLYAQDGVWNGERILPEGWVATSAAPAPNSRGRHGAHLWLNADPDGDGDAQRMWPDLPADLLHMDGHEGQYVIVVPSEQLVIVRLGCTKAGGFDLRGMIRNVLSACTAR